MFNPQGNLNQQYAEAKRLLHVSDKSFASIVGIKEHTLSRRIAGAEEWPPEELAQARQRIANHIQALVSDLQTLAATFAVATQPENNS